MIYRALEKVQKRHTTNARDYLFCSLKNYSSDIYVETLERISFPNYENFEGPDIAFISFIGRLDYVLNAVAPFQRVRVKNMKSVTT